MKYNEWKQMHKQAGGGLLGAAIDAFGAGFNIATAPIVLLIAGTAAAGTGLGYGLAKINAHGKQEIDTIQKEYENERLKADLGYLAAKSKSEYKQLQNKTAPKAARVIA